jgi:Na+/H+ antiporter NhaD/arsenite permease-like protein
MFLGVLVLTFRAPVLRWGAWSVPLDMTTAPWLAVALQLAAGMIAPRDVVNGLVGDEFVAPWAILVLFFSIAYLSVSLDRTGMFEALAHGALRRAHSNRRIFLTVFALASALTTFTSNDIVTLTLGPILCHMARVAGPQWDVMPHLVAMFLAANVLSIALFTGNPTNVIVAVAYRLSFFEYSRWMLVPALAAAAACAAAALWYFRGRVDVPLPAGFGVADGAALPPLISYLRDPAGAKFGSACLGLCLAALAAAPLLRDAPLWAICLVFFSVMLARDIVHDMARPASHVTLQEEEAGGEDAPTPAEAAPDAGDAPGASEAAVAVALGLRRVEQVRPLARVAQPRRCVCAAQAAALNARLPTVMSVVRGMPWPIAPFAAGMFVLVYGMRSVGLVDTLAEGVTALFEGRSSLAVVLGFTFLAALAMNVLNNQPASILGVFILRSPQLGLSSEHVRLCMFSLVIASNLGANLTLIGALAGLMWQKILANHGIRISFGEFARYGFVITPPVIFVAGVAYWVLVAAAGDA